MRNARSLLAVTLLVAGMLAWAAVPMTGASAGAKPAFIVAICCGAFALVKLATAGPQGDRMFASALERIWRQAISALQAGPWPQLLIVAVIGLEALHPRRPWHTAVLGVVLLGYLLAFHRAESGAKVADFRPQLPLIAAGIALAAISVAAAALPTSTSGSGSGWLAVLAAIAAIVAAALTLPV